MRIYSILSLALIGLATFPQPASAAPLTLEPTTEWKLREYEDKCRISRVFGTGKDRVSLWIDQGDTRASYNVTLIGRPFRKPYGPNVSVQFAPEPEYSRAYLRTKSSKGRPVISLFGTRLTPTNEERADLGLPVVDKPKTVRFSSAPPIAVADPAEMSAERIAAISEIRFGRAFSKPVVLETGAMTGALEQLRTCAQKVSAAIAINTALSPTRVEPTNVDRWVAIIRDSYPNSQRKAGLEASILVSLTVGVSGRPTFCDVTEITGPSSFNDTACLLMLKHATFNPARNADGDPVPAYFTIRVTFRLV